MGRSGVSEAHSSHGVTLHFTDGVQFNTCCVGPSVDLEAFHRLVQAESSREKICGMN